jgi:mTERF domain-containing protein
MGTNAMNGGICTLSSFSWSIYTNSPDGHSFRRRLLLTIPQIISSRPFAAYTFCTHGRLQSASKPATAIHPTTVASPSPLANEFQESEETSSNPDIFSAKDEAVFRKQNAKSLALLNSSSSPKTFETPQEDDALFDDEEVGLALVLDKDDVTRAPRFPGSVSGARGSRVEQLLSQGKGRSDWEEQMLRQALSIRRQRTKDVLKEAMKASELSDRYSENLVSHMDGFVDYIIIRAASAKSRSEFATWTFTARAKFCIRQSGVVELVKWLKHNQLSYPRIGMLVSTVADDLEGLKLRIRWLKSIHVKGRYLGVVLMRQESILTRPIEDLDDNVQFLESHGVLIDWMGFVVSHCPEILSFSMEELKCRVNFFLELGMNDNDFGTMVFEYPKVIGFFSIADMINKVFSLHL